MTPSLNSYIPSRCILSPFSYGPSPCRSRFQGSILVTPPVLVTSLPPPLDPTLSSSSSAPVVTPGVLGPQTGLRPTHSRRKPKTQHFTEQTPDFRGRPRNGSEKTWCACSLPDHDPPSAPPTPGRRTYLGTRDTSRVTTKVTLHPRNARIQFRTHSSSPPPSRGARPVEAVGLKGLF